MRILWLSHFLPHPPIGGAPQRSHHLLRRAAERHEVHLVALNHRGMHPTMAEVHEAREALAPLCESVRIFHKSVDRSRARWWWMTLTTFFRRESYETRWLRCPDLRSFLASWRLDFDLVHVDAIGLSPYAEPFRARDVPVVLTHHNVESDMMALRARREPNRLKRLYFRREAAKLARDERTWAPRAATNLVVSELDRARLTRIVGEVPTAVVPNGVDVEYFRPHPEREEEEGRLVFVGGMNGYANRDAVLFFLERVWPRLDEAGGSYSWTVVGAQPPSALVQAASSDPRIEVTGFVPDARPYVDRASVYVCPILDGGGTRLKVLDALAMEKALLATSFAVEGLGLQPETHFLAADSPEGFAERIGELAADPARRRKLAQCGRDYVRNRFSWDRIAETLHAAYETACSRPDGRGGSGADRAEVSHPMKTGGRPEGRPPV